MDRAKPIPRSSELWSMIWSEVDLEIKLISTTSLWSIQSSSSKEVLKINRSKSIRHNRELQVDQHLDLWLMLSISRFWQDSG